MVVFLFCYDLSLPPKQQQQQIEYWLYYLHAVLFPFLQYHHITSSTLKWRIIIIGTRANLNTNISNHNNENFSSNKVPILHKEFPSLPIYHKIFHVSTNPESPFFSELSELSTTIKSKCLSILDNHTKQVPCTFQDLWNALQSHPQHILHESDISKIQLRWATNSQLKPALDFLQVIGYIIQFEEGKICTKPIMISQVFAKSISSKEHIHQFNPIFQKTDIASIRSIDEACLTDKYVHFFKFTLSVIYLKIRIRENLELLHFFGVCFPIPVVDSSITGEGSLASRHLLYLFSSIQSEGIFVIIICYLSDQASTRMCSFFWSKNHCTK